MQGGEVLPGVPAADACCLGDLIYFVRVRVRVFPLIIVEEGADGGEEEKEEEEEDEDNQGWLGVVRRMPCIVIIHFPHHQAALRGESRSLKPACLPAFLSPSVTEASRQAGW